MGIDKAVIDSSVVVALLTPEKYSEWADEMLGEVGEWISLDLIYYEVANTIWKKYMRLRLLRREDAYEALNKAFEILRYMFQIHSFNNLVVEAFKLAEELDITVYDAGYITLAEKLGIKLITLDKKLYGKLRGTGHKEILITPQSQR